MNLLRFSICVLALSTVHGCTGQKTGKDQIVVVSDFNWSISVPSGFQSVSAPDWEKMQNKGANAIEKTYGEDVVNRSKTIFVFKNDQLNYFESNSQPFDVRVDGDYLQSCRAVDEVLYNTFKSQLPGIEIDTVRTVETIDGLEFQTMRMKVVYPNKMVLNLLMFSRLFDKKELSVNIMFADEAKGAKMLKSWRESRFSSGQ